MRKYYLLFWLLLPVGLAAQPIAVMSDNIKYIYIGVPNDLTIVVSDVPPERLIVAVSQGTIETVDRSQGKYRWTICERKIDLQNWNWQRPPDWLSLADSSLDHPVDTFFYKVQYPYDIHFQSPKEGNNTSAELTGYFDEYGLEDFPPQVLGFDATFLLHGQEPIPLHNDGAIFNNELAGYLQQLAPGDQAHFYNILWKSGCNPYINESYQYQIKVKQE